MWGLRNTGGLTQHNLGLRLQEPFTAKYCMRRCNFIRNTNLLATCLRDVEIHLRLREFLLVAVHVEVARGGGHRPRPPHARPAVGGHRPGPGPGLRGRHPHNRI